MLKKLNSWKSTNFDARATLCKATLATIKSLPSSIDINSRVDADRCWKHVSDFFTYAHLIEQDGGTIDDVLIDEVGRVICSFQKSEKPDTPFKRLFAYSTRVLDPWARWIYQNDLLPVNIMSSASISRSDKDMTDSLFALAVEANLKHYVEHKLLTMPQLIKTSFSQRPILDRALRLPLLMPWMGQTGKIDPDMIRLLLLQGANPNEELTVYTLETPPNQELTHQLPVYAWTTVWALFLQQLHRAKISNVRKSPESVQCELEVTKLMIENGAAADIRPWSVSALSNVFSGPIVTPSDVFHEVFPLSDAILLDQLLKKNRPWALRRACALLRRTVLLWFYRDIYAVVWLPIWLYPGFFNQTLGVILPMVVIPTIIYFLSLVWPFVVLILSGTAPILLTALILSDWIPVVDFLIWCNDSFRWRDGSLAFDGLRYGSSNGTIWGDAYSKNTYVFLGFNHNSSLSISSSFVVY